jgi:hypothetical protein
VLPLELEAVCGAGHLRVEVLQHILGAPLQEEDGLADHFRILVGGAIGGAGSDATLDVVIEAGAGIIAGDGLGAGPPREELLHHIERAADGARRGVRPEVAGAVTLHPADDLHPGIGAGEVDAEIGEVLVVAEFDVVLRLVLLNQVRLENERLDL